MKNLIKKIINKIVDLIFLPFEFIYSFIKNADNIIYAIIRLILILALLFSILYIFIAKPYKKILSGFYFEKYKSNSEAKTILLSLMPLANTTTEQYTEYFKKIGSQCIEKNDKKGKFYNCFYYENLIFKKYEWMVFIRPNIKKIKVLSITKKQIDNDFVKFYKIMLSKI